MFLFIFFTVILPGPVVKFELFCLFQRVVITYELCQNNFNSCCFSLCPRLVSFTHFCCIVNLTLVALMATKGLKQGWYKIHRKTFTARTRWKSCLSSDYVRQLFKIFNHHHELCLKGYSRELQTIYGTHS